MKRQPINVEKIFVSHLSAKGLISKISEESIQLNCRKAQTIWLINGQCIWIDICSKKRYKWAVDTWKGPWYHLSSGKCTWSTVSHLLKWLLSKWQELTISAEDVEKREALCTVSEIHIGEPSLKTVWRFLKKIKIRTTVWLRNSTSGYISEENKNTNSKR